MLLTSHLDNLHNVTDLKMHGEEDPFPSSVALWDFCGFIAVSSVVAPPGAVCDLEGGRTGTEHQEAQVPLLVSVIFHHG